MTSEVPQAANKSMQQQQHLQQQHLQQPELNQETDGNESTGSPRSYDSQSSIGNFFGLVFGDQWIHYYLLTHTMYLLLTDDKVTTSIRNRPIPRELKSLERGEEEEMIPLDEDTMDSTSSSTVQPTSNLVAPDSLKKGAPAYQMDQDKGRLLFIGRLNMQSLSFGAFIDCIASPPNAPHSLEDLINKDNKTLNVNVLADGEENQPKNNELNFDSEKFCKRRSAEKNARRPKETIDNLSSSEAADTVSDEQAADGKKTLQHKHKIKVSNVNSSSCDDGGAVNGVEGGAHEDGFEFNAIKRIRLDSSEREKNVRLARQQQQQQMNMSPSEEQAKEQIDEEVEPMTNGEGGTDKIEVDENDCQLASASGTSGMGINGGRSLVDTR